MIDNAKLLCTFEQKARSVWVQFCKIYPVLRNKPMPAIQLNNRIYRTAGMCYQNARIIHISAKFCKAGFMDYLMEGIVPHEIIHQVDYDLYGPSEKKCGHGKQWQKLMVNYGLGSDKYHSLPLITAKGELIND